MSVVQPGCEDLSYRREHELTLSERDSRWSRVRAAMAEAGLDIIVTAPNSGAWDQLQAHATYLSTIGGNNAPVSVVFPGEGAVTAVVGPVPSVEFWRSWQTWVTDVRMTHWAVGDGVVARLRELGADGQRIGIPGLKGSPRVPDGLVATGFVERLVQAFPRATIVDATDLMDEVRATKTAEERDAVANAMAMAEDAFNVLLAEARPGVAERVVYGKMVGRLIEQGSQPSNFLMWLAGTAFPFSLAPFPTGRQLVAGEPVYCEIEARSSAGYLAQITRMAVLGRPNANLQAMFDLAADTFEGVLASMRPGASMADVLTVYKERSAQSRYRVVPVIHARALGEDRPMIVFGTEDPAILQYEIKQNHVFALKVQVRDPDTGEMGFWGESVAIGANGAVRLAKDAIRLSVIE